MFPRFEGCVITECAAKQRDTFDSGDAAKQPVEASVSSLTYSCPAADRQKMKAALDAQLLKAGYQKVLEDKADSKTTVTARRGAHWLRWEAESDDSETSYSLTLADPVADKTKEQMAKADACGGLALSSLKQCEVVECGSKSEDSAALRTASAAQTAVTGQVQTFTLTCPAHEPGQVFSSVEDELKTSGYEIVFSDQNHPADGWITARAGKRWMELGTVPGDDTGMYSLTLVPSGEVLMASNNDPPAAGAIVGEPAAPPSAALAPKLAPPNDSTVLPESKPAGTVAAIHAAPESYTPLFIPPKPLTEVPIDATPERVASVRGDVVINILVDVDEHGAVTKAVLTGRITKDVRTLESAALDAVSRWHFEPARQDGRIVPSVKIPVQIHFQGRSGHFYDFLTDN